MKILTRNATGYSLVPDENDNLPPKKRAVWHGHTYRRILFPLISLLVFGAGIIIGAMAQGPILSLTGLKAQDSYSERVLGMAPTFRRLEHTFSYNRTFGADPSENESTNDAWDSIVPLGQGTVRLPESSAVYTLSVIHQLHCLWSLHQSFYTALHADPGTVNMEQDFPHIRHCFDYIRQALMCSADPTLEPVDMVLGGVTGWNGTHVCRDFGALTSWAEDHRTNNLRGFRQAHKSHHGHHG